MDVDLCETPLSSVVALAPVLTGAVQLRGSLWTEDPDSHAQHLDRYIPTQSGREALLGVLRGTRHAAPTRVHFLTGSYGTGKSYLLLILASLLGLRLDDPRLAILHSRIEKGEETYKDGLAKELAQMRKLEQNSDRPGYGYLVVVPDYSDREYDRAILQGLRQALAGAQIEYRFPTEFAEAEEVLARWRAERPEFMKKLEPLLDADHSSPEGLARELETLDGEALARFARYFEAVTGAPYRPARLSLEETFRQTSTHIQKLGYRGIAVLFDEFGLFLEAAAAQAGSAVAAVQGFMEFAKSRSAADILLVLAAHRDLEAYGLGEGGRAEMKKMEGRIEKQYRLRASAAHREAEEMIAGAFVPQGEGSEARQAALHLLERTAHDEGWADEAAVWYEGAGREWIDRTIICGAYPLHPTTTLALPGLSDDVGQNTRTMFRFLDPKEVGAAATFIEQSPVEQGGRPVVLLLDGLFDYFVAPAAAGGGGGRQGVAYSEYKLARSVLRGTDELADRVLKAVTVIGLLADPRLQATPRTLRWALNLAPDQQGELDDLLAVLVTQGALRQNQNTKIYSFRSAGGTSMDALLAKKKRDLGTLAPEAVLGLLRKARDPGAHDPTTYNDEFHTNRRVAFDYVLPGSEDLVLAKWQKQFERLYQEGDSKDYEGNLVALYGLGESAEELESLRKRLQAATHDGHVLAGVAADPLPLHGLALDVAAAAALLDDPKVRADDNAQNEVSILLDQYQQSLADALDRALTPSPSKFDWYRSGERAYQAGELSSRGLRRFLDKSVEEVFPDTPKINSDVVQQYPSMRSTSHMRDREGAADRMLSAAQFTLAGTGSVDATLKGVLVPNGMFHQEKQQGNQWYGVVVPPDRESSLAKAWSELKTLLHADERPRKETKLDEAKRLLYGAPFGLSWTAAEIVLAAFIATDRDSFELRDKNNKQLALSGSVLLDALRRKGPYTLVHQAIAPAERRLLEVVNEVLRRRRLPDVDLSLGPWADPASRLADWYKNLPELTRKRAGEQDAHTDGVLKALGEHRSTRDDQAARELILIALPAALDVQNVDSTEGATDVARGLEAAIKSASRYTDDFAEQLLQDAAFEAFKKACSGSVEFAAEAEAWLKQLSPAAKQHHYGSPADALLRTVTRSSSESVVDRYLASLPREWQMTSFRGWKTKKQREDYVRAFRDAVREVDAYRASPLPALNRLQKEALGSESNTEDEVGEAFKAWARSLPDRTQDRLADGHFGESASALYAAIFGTGSVEERLLQRLPAQLPQVHGEWPNWPPPSLNVLVQDVAGEMRAIEAWRPALSVDAVATLLLERLGWAADPDVSSTEALDAAAQSWYADLAPAAKRRVTGGLADVIVEETRGEAGLAAALAETLPRAAGLPALAEANDAEDSTRLVDAIAGAIEELGAWRRPELDVLQRAAEAWGGASLREASDFTLRLSGWSRTLQAEPGAEGLTPVTAALLEWAGAAPDWRPAFVRFREVAGLPDDPHGWGPKDDRAFADALQAARVEAEAWEPPPPDPAELKAAVTQALQRVLDTTGASRAELLAVLFDAAGAVTDA